MAGLQTDDAAFAAYAEAERDQYILEKKLGTSHDHIVSEAASQELDGIHDGLEFPTDEERETLRRVSDHIPWNAYRMYCVRILTPSRD
jgi:proton-dependent oligopeptide transporter, POT family